MRIAAIQHDVVWEDAVSTTSQLVQPIAAAASGGARLIVLTEMFATGFTSEPERLAEPATGGVASRFLSEQAERHGVWVAGSIAVSDGDRFVNRFTLAGPSGERFTYDKIHPFSYAGEHEHYAAGTEIVTFDVEGVRVTPFVCYDLRFADEFWSAAEATDLYVVPANWPESRRHHWKSLLTARAIENQAYVIGVNRVGSGGGLDYSGDSMIIDPAGETLASAAQSEAVLLVDIDAARVAETRARFPFLPDRR